MASLPIDRYQITPLGDRSTRVNNLPKEWLGVETLTFRKSNALTITTRGRTRWKRVAQELQILTWAREKSRVDYFRSVAPSSCPLAVVLIVLLPRVVPVHHGTTWIQAILLSGFTLFRQIKFLDFQSRWTIVIVQQLHIKCSFLASHF